MQTRPTFHLRGWKPPFHLHTVEWTVIDHFMPFNIKRYELLFTCVCSRAIRIKVLEDLPTDAFLNLLCAFFPIRDNVKGDQDTNSVGPQDEFQGMMMKIEQERRKELGCSFVINLLASSHIVSGKGRLVY